MRCYIGLVVFCLCAALPLAMDTQPLPTEMEHPYSPDTEGDPSLDSAYGLQTVPGTWQASDSAMLRADADQEHLVLPRTTLLSKQHDVVAPGQSYLRVQSPANYLLSR